MIDNIPETLEEAVDFVLTAISNSPEELPEKLKVGMFHHGYGTALRNDWGLWHDSVLARHFKERFGLGHADDMSGLILGLAFARYNGEEFDIDADVQRYKRHWKKYNIDPLTQKELN